MSGERWYLGAVSSGTAERSVVGGRSVSGPDPRQGAGAWLVHVSRDGRDGLSGHETVTAHAGRMSGHSRTV